MVARLPNCKGEGKGTPVTIIIIIPSAILPEMNEGCWRAFGGPNSTHISHPSTLPTWPCHWATSGIQPLRLDFLSRLLFQHLFCLFLRNCISMWLNSPSWRWQALLSRIMKKWWKLEDDHFATINEIIHSIQGNQGMLETLGEKLVVNWIFLHNVKLQDPAVYLQRQIRQCILAPSGCGRFTLKQIYHRH